MNNSLNDLEFKKFIDENWEIFVKFIWFLKNLNWDKINPATEEKQDELLTSYNNTKDISWALKIIEIEHHRIHNWQAYRTTLYTTIWSWNSVYCQLKVWEKTIHLKEKHLIDWTNIIFCRFYENPTTIIDWNIQIPIYNANRLSSNTSSVNMYSNPTWLTLTDNIVNNATLLHTTYLPWTNQSAWWWRDNSIERILKPNTNYLFQAYNSSAWTAPINAEFFWYEI